ncbi:MAG: hypothetical protein IT373_33865 [Polyangiaceae bacterium]|nr:hypothetical protein [Polyangiaceae bacterium]
MSNQALVLPTAAVLVQRAGLVRAAGRGAAVGSAAALAGTIAFAAIGAAGPAVAFGLVHLVSLAAAVFLLAARHRPPSEQRGHPGQIRVGAGELEIATAERHHRFPTAEVEGGWIEWHGAWPYAVMQLRDRSLVYVQTHTHAQASALIAAAGARQRAVAMRARRSRIDHPRTIGCVAVASAYLCVPLLIGAFFVRAGRDNPLPAIVLGIIVFASLAIGLLARFPSTRVVVGTDGIELKRPLSRRRFIPYSELHRVTLEGPTIRPYLRFERAREAPIDLRVASYLEGETLCARIREAMAGAGTRSTFDVAALDRGGLSLAEWRASLAKLLARSAGYRQRVVEALDLAQAAESAAVTPSRRVAAALALSSSGDENLRQRVRIAAEGCANPAVKRALLAAAEGEVDEATLEQLSRDEARA